MQADIPPGFLSGLVTDKPEPVTLPWSNARPRRASGGPAGPETLLFGLSLAIGLPPGALVVAPGARRISVNHDAVVLLRPTDLEAALHRPVSEVGRGWVALEEVDRRLSHLTASLSVFRTDHGSGALVSLGVAWPGRQAGVAGGATAADLWRLARTALPRYGLVCELGVDLGADACLVLHGGVTAQLVWLADEQLATVSVTSLAGDGQWLIEAARSIGTLLDRRLRLT